MTSDWQDYIITRKTGIKRRWKALLEERINYIASLSKDERVKYLNNLCHDYFDLDKTDIPIQHPYIWDQILEIWREKQIWDDSTSLFWLAKALTSTKGNFQNAYLLLNKHPVDILKRIISLEPDHFNAKKILFECHLYTLDFAMHSIDSGMLINKNVGDRIIAECEELIKSEPNLKSCKSTFGGDFEYYKNRFLAWHEYSKKETELDFDDWYFDNHPLN